MNLFTGANIAKKLQENNLIIVEGATVSVHNRTTGSLALLFEDKAGTIPLSNPFVADDTGQFFFYIDEGEYKLTVQSGPVQGSIFFEVNDPADNDFDYVTYEQFGADLTGVLPADDQIIACHEFANANNKDVRQRFGTVYWQNKTALVKTNTNLNGLTVRMDSGSGTPDLTYQQPIMFKVDRKETPIDLDANTIIELNTTYSDYFKPLSMRLPPDIFSQYSGRLIKITGTEDDTWRS